MILQALCDYYDILDTDPNTDIPSQGYSNAKISYALNISKEGELKNIISLKVKGEKGSKLFPRLMTVPYQEKRQCNVFPYFLCDNSKYVFGLSKDKKKLIEVFEEHFNAFKKYNLEILQNVENDEAKAVINFLNKWNVQKAEEILTSVNGFDEDIFDNSNFVFLLKDDYIHNNADIRKAWISNNEETIKGEKGQCLITGKYTRLKALHGNLKGVKDAQPVGAAIVSFNAKSYESYGKEDAYNAPVGIESAFKYVTVLNYMLQNDSAQKIQIGDATTVFWAKSSSPVYSEIFNALFNPPVKSDDKKSEEEKVRDEKTEYIVKSTLSVIKQGGKVSDVNKDIDDNTDFYILGLSPNNARIAVRYFHRDTFGNFIHNLAQHHSDIELEGKPKYLTYIPIWIILNEIIPKNSKNKKHNALLTGKITNSIITGSNYPYNFLTSVISKIKADQDINYLRVAIIKGYLTRKVRKEIELIKSKKTENSESDKKQLTELEKLKKEVLNVSLNEETKNVPYRLGRLFYLLEKIQRSALGDINAGIKDRYFSTASVTPGRVFPTLIRNNNHHLAKIEGNWADIEMGQIMDGLEVSPEESNYGFPALLNLEEQGLFVIGYYHQRQHDINQAVKAKAEKEAKKKETKELVEV